MRRLLLELVMLLVPLLLAAQKGNQQPTKVRLVHVSATRSEGVIRAAEKQGVTATLKYEQIADMVTPRIGHQIFPSGNGFVVVGGHTTGFQLTKTAELYQNGSWQSLSIANPHDGAFSVRLSDGRYMVGGGFTKANGSGQNRATDIYDPQTRTFTAGPQLTVARAKSKAINAGGKVYVSGNWNVDDPTMDLYDGTSFTAVGQTDDRSNPYMMADRQDNLMVFSINDTMGESYGFYTDDDGVVMLLADRYISSTGLTKYIALPFRPLNCPLALPDDARPADYHITYNGNNCYLLLAKVSTSYMLYMFDIDDLKLYNFGTFDIPIVDGESKRIQWRGSVLTNESRKELYMIGTSGGVKNQTLHVISLNYVTDEWTIASAPGFNHDMLSASWTVLSDGRLACTGGGIKDDTDAQRSAYLITPPVAGLGDDDTPDTPAAGGPKLVVWLKSGEKVVYELADVPITTFKGSQLVIRTNKVTIPYERKNVLRYTYEDVVTKGVELMPGERRVEINRDGDEITFRGLQAGSIASIYAVNGTLVEQRKVTDSQPMTLSLKNRPNGVYIVKAGTETIKVMKQ